MDERSVYIAGSKNFREMLMELSEIASAPQGHGWGLPGKFYTEQSYFDYEYAGILRNGWHCAGRADELPNVGDYLTLNFLGEPIIIVRNENGLMALSNVCRHRGMRLVEGTGNRKKFVCPYHAWIYRTDGTLLRAPRMTNKMFDVKTCKLGKFACVERSGFIYFCLGEDPEDLNVELSGLDDLIKPYSPQAYRLAHSEVEVWKVNWKSLIENFVEGYHLSVVHPETLHGYTPTGLCKKAPSGNGFTSYHANYPQGTANLGQGAPNLTAEQRQRSTIFSVFPCHVVSISPSLLVSLCVRPLTVDSIEVKWTLSVYESELDDETVAKSIALWQRVNTEDREKLEAMQISLRSAHAMGGPLAGTDFEGTIQDFLNWLVRQDAKLKESLKL